MKIKTAITSILLVTLILMLFNTSAEAQRRRRHPSQYKRMPRIAHREHHNRDESRDGDRHVIIRFRHHKDYRNRHRDYRHYREDREHRSDRFYRRHRLSFFGIRFRILPSHYYRFEIGTHIYFYNRGNYFVYRHHYYEPVPPPIGARVDQLPEGCNKVVINGRIYYELDGVYYQACVNQYGEVYYEVVGFNRRELDE